MAEDFKDLLELWQNDSESLFYCFTIQVLMKDIVTPVPPEEVRNVIKKCLENAALVNYTRISEYAKIEGKITKLK